MKNKIQLHKVVFVLLVGLCFWHSVELKKDILRRIPSDNYTVNFENPDLLRLADETEGDIFRVAVVGPSNSSAYSASYDNFYPGFAQVHGFETTDGYLSLFSKRYEDFWYQVVAPLRLMDSSIDKRWGNIAKWIYLYAPFDGSFDKADTIEFDEYYDLNLLSLANTKFIISRWLLEDKYLKLVNDPESIKAMRDKWKNTSKRGKLLHIIKGDMLHRPLYIYENTKSLPRTFIVHRAKFFDNDQALLAAMGKASVQDFATTIYLNSEDVSSPDIKNVNTTYSSSAEIVEYSPDELVISVESSAPGYLVVTNNYSPYWKCFVDGIEEKIVPAYHTFQAVCLPAGKVVVSFKYRPPYFFCGR